MKYRGTELILDNFRVVLSGFTVDVQDVVRSAILDGVDISSKIDELARDPYKLDQYRLLQKEGMVGEVPLEKLSGWGIGELRALLRKKDKKSLDIVKNQLDQTRGTMSDDHLRALLDWIVNSYEFGGVKVCSIPKDLLSVYATGLSKGVDIKPFTESRVNYSAGNLGLRLQIASFGVAVTPLVAGEWSDEVLKLLVFFAQKGNKKAWNSVLSCIDDGISSDRLRVVVFLSLSLSPAVLKKLQSKTSGGKYLFDDSSLELLEKSIQENLGVEGRLEEVSNGSELRALFNSMSVESRKNRGGRIHKNMLLEGD